MKKAIFLFAAAIGLASCQDQQDDIFTTMPLPPQVEYQGEWRISLFVEDGLDETMSFQPYLFQFDSTGAVVASSSSTTTMGTYLIFQDDGQTELAMQFPMNSALYELTDEWYFVSLSDTSWHLADGGDVLHFIRN